MLKREIRKTVKSVMQKIGSQENITNKLKNTRLHIRFQLTVSSFYSSLSSRSSFWQDFKKIVLAISSWDVVELLDWQRDFFLGRGKFCFGSEQILMFCLAREISRAVFMSSQDIKVCPSWAVTLHRRPRYHRHHPNVLVLGYLDRPF